MASNRKNYKQEQNKINGIIDGAGSVIEQHIDTTIKENYMPYAMSVIMSRALPEIDGFKPSHRKLLYTMYKMGLLNSGRTKSANIVGQTMKLNPHGDSSIYDTMVRLSRGYEALLHPYIDSKGNFGKYYSRDMAYAASRYTEAKLDDLCNELFNDIDKDTIDFVDNYDNTLKEPTLLPTTFPSILVNANMGIAVGMASSICPFNLSEVCLTTIELLKNENHDIISTLIAPDFPGGGQIVFVGDELKEIYRTGKGSFKVRSRYSYDKSCRCIDILNIPPTTTIEVIIEKVIELIKAGKIKEISDIRDETGIDGLKITIDLKKGVDPDALMLKLFKMTTLQDSFSCNFNVLISGMPRVLGVKEILEEWIAFRIECVRRRTYFDCNKKQEKLHLLVGLSKILLDIDKAIKIIRNTKEETEVIPNLMEGFNIDKLQAEYVAEIKLRHLNREYILNRINEVDKLKEEINILQGILASKTKVKNIIINELNNCIKKYKQPRKSILIMDEEKDIDITEDKPDYPVTIFFTKHGYLKKITPLSLRMGKEQKLKEDDKIVQQIETTNTSDVLIFTDKFRVYKTKAYEFEDTKASSLGEFVSAKLNMEEDESSIYMAVTKNYNGYMIFFFENGKVAKVEMKEYLTKTNRKRLTNAYSDKFKLVSIFYIEDDKEFLLCSTSGKGLLINSKDINPKTTRTTQGVSIFNIRKGHKLSNVSIFKENMLENPDKFKKKNLPSAGSPLNGKL